MTAAAARSRPSPPTSRGSGHARHQPDQEVPAGTRPAVERPALPEWAVWGFYTEPVNPRMVVHNEEHGGVIIWWGSKVPAATVAKLHAFYNEQPTARFGTPYPKLGSKIAITAWTGNPSTTSTTATSARATSPSARTSPRRRRRRSRTSAMPTAATARRASRSPPTSPATGPPPREALSLTPCRGGGTGRRSRLKTGGPSGTWGFDSLPRHYLARSDHVGVPLSP